MQSRGVLNAPVYTDVVPTFALAHKLALPHLRVIKVLKWDTSYLSTILSLAPISEAGIQN
jgi:hypothetical protein